MDFTIKFYAFYNLGNNFKKSKKLKIQGKKKLIKKPRVLRTANPCVNGEKQRFFINTQK
jgi:hypothetical protein